MRLWRFAVFALLAMALGLPAYGREAGWAPLPDAPWQPPLKPGAPDRHRRPAQKAPQPQAHKGATVYEGQPPLTEAELMDFMALLPRFRAWARQNHEEAHPVINKQGNADFLYSLRAAQWVTANNFNPPRFFCAMGRMAACLAIIEEGNDFHSGRPGDMPKVDQSEISLARRHLGELLTAGGSAAPIK